MLLVLDNFEQLVGAVGPTVGRWLDTVPAASFLVTSRERLAIAGEHVLVLASLPPADAIGLFERRALAAGALPASMRAERKDIRALVAALDHLPLAIELAAARVRVWSPRRILERLSDRFQVLAGSAGVPARQATLRAMLDWNWELLAPEERAGLAQASVFRGGFDASAFEAVVAVDGAWTPGLLQALVDKSLVSDLGGGRYDLVQVVHAYAADRLGSMAPPGLAQRHTAHYAALGATATLDNLDAAGAEPLRAGLVAELANLVAAHAAAVTAEDAPSALDCACGAWAVLTFFGPFGQAVELLASALAVGEPAGIREVEALIMLGRAQEWAGDVATAEKTLRRAAERAWAQGSPSHEGRALTALATAGRGHLGPAESLALLDTAEALIRPARAMGALMHLSATVANVLLELDDFAGAKRLLQEGLEVARLVGSRGHEMAMLGNLGRLRGPGIPPEDRLALHEEALALCRSLGHRRAEGPLINNRATVLRDLGRVDEALEDLNVALTVHRAIGNRVSEAVTLSNLAEIHLNEGRHMLTGVAARAALGLFHQLGFAAHEACVGCTLGRLELQAGRPEAAWEHYTAAAALGVSGKDPAVEGSALAGLAECHRRAGRLAEADTVSERAFSLVQRDREQLLRPRVAFWRALTLLELGRRGEAGEALRRVEALHVEVGAVPDRCLAGELAEARARLGQGGRASATGRAGPVGPSDPATRAAIGRAGRVSGPGTRRRQGGRCSPCAPSAASSGAPRRGRA